MSSPPRRVAGLAVGGGSVQLGRVAGVPVFVSWSSVVLLALITAVYGPVADQYSPDLAGAAGYGASAVFALILGASILLHELGHACVGRALGLEVGRVELDLLGGGTTVARSRRPREEFAVAAIGPVVNVVLALGAGIAAATIESHTAVWTIALWTAWGNGSVAVFNLIPGLPLDGGRILGAGIWAVTGDYPRAITVAAWTGRAVAAGVVGLALALQAAGRGSALSLPILAILALYLWTSASSALSWSRSEGAIEHLVPARLVRPIALMHRSASVADAIEQARAAAAEAVCVLDDDLRPFGLLTDELGAIVQDYWADIRIGELVQRPPAYLGPPDLADGHAARDALRREPSHDYLVLGPDGRPAGHLRARDLLDALGGARQGGAL